MSETGTQQLRLNRVRELRENKLMTQAQLARKAKVALRTIHSVEKVSTLKKYPFIDDHSHPRI